MMILLFCLSVSSCLFVGIVADTHQMISIIAINRTWNTVTIETNYGYQKLPAKTRRRIHVLRGTGLRATDDCTGEVFRTKILYFDDETYYIP